MNSSLLASIKGRERAAAAAAAAAAATAGTEGADTMNVSRADDNDGTDATTKQHLLSVLKEKEQDLELAAKIGEALFQENTQLRKDSQALDELRVELENTKVAVQTLTNKKNALTRRVDHLSNNLREADATNEILANKVTKMKAEMKGSEERHVRDVERAASDARDSLTLEANQSTFGSPRSTTSKQSSPHRSPRKVRGSGETGGMDNVNEETNDSTTSDDEDVEDGDALLQAEIIRRQQCEEELIVLQNKLESAEQTVLEQIDRSRVRDAHHQDELHTLRAQYEELEAENAALRDDLCETRDLLDARRDAFAVGHGDRPRTYSTESGVCYSPGRGARGESSGGISSPFGPPRTSREPPAFSLEAELAGAALTSPEQPSDATGNQGDNQTDESRVDDRRVENESGRHTSGERRKSQDDAVDPYFFHFHMTAMSVKAHISLKGSTVGAGTGLNYPSVNGGIDSDTKSAEISRHSMNAINQLDTRAMYEDVVDKCIPPHHWIGYIRDAYSQAHIKSLLAARRASHNAAAAAAAVAETNQHKPTFSTPTRGRSLATPSSKGKPGSVGSVFGRLLRAVSTRMQSPTTATASGGQRGRLDVGEVDVNRPRSLRSAETDNIHNTHAVVDSSVETAVRASPRGSAGVPTQQLMPERPSRPVVSVVAVAEEEPSPMVGGNTQQHNATTPPRAE
jgi:chaperonin cofactor prefoldin